MKEKILYAVIGALIGAIITTAIFLIFRPGDRRLGFQERGMELRGDKEELLREMLDEKEMDLEKGVKPGDMKTRENKSLEEKNDGDNIELFDNVTESVDNAEHVESAENLVKENVEANKKDN